MAITVQTEPSSLMLPSANPMRWVLSSDNTDQFGMNYIVDVYVGGVFAYRSAIAPDPQYNYGVFDAAKKLKHYVSLSLISATTTNGVVHASNEKVTATLELGESYSYWSFQSNSDGGGSLQLNGSLDHPFEIGDEVFINIGAGGTYTQYNGFATVIGVPDSDSIIVDKDYLGASSTVGRVKYANGSEQFHTGLTSVDQFYVFKSAYTKGEDVDYTDFISPSTNKTFLTNIPNKQWTLRDDSRCWLYGIVTNALDHFDVFTYDASGTQIGDYELPMSFNVVTQFEMVYVRCGPVDLNECTDLVVNSGNSTPIHDGVAFYKVRSSNSAGSALGAWSTFNIDRRSYGRDCEAPKQLFFRDQKGSFVPVAFKSAQVTTWNTKKQIYKKNNYVLNADGSINDDIVNRAYTAFEIQDERTVKGKLIFNTKADAKYFVDDCIRSSDVFELQNDGTLIPVLINDASYSYASPKVSNGRIIYEIEYSYAYDESLNL